VIRRDTLEVLDYLVIMLIPL